MLDIKVTTFDREILVCQPNVTQAINDILNGPSIWSFANGISFYGLIAASIELTEVAGVACVRLVTEADRIKGSMPNAFFLEHFAVIPEVKDQGVDLLLIAEWVAILKKGTHEGYLRVNSLLQRELSKMGFAIHPDDKKLMVYSH